MAFKYGNDMEQYYNLVIDTLKSALSDYVSTGEIDMEQVGEAISRLEFETDRRIVNREPADELAGLRDTLLWLKCDLFEYEQA